MGVALRRRLTHNVLRFVVNLSGIWRESTLSLYPWVIKVLCGLVVKT